MFSCSNGCVNFSLFVKCLLLIGLFIADNLCLSLIEDLIPKDLELLSIIEIKLSIISFF